MINFILFWLALPIAGAIYGLCVSILMFGKGVFRIPIKNAQYLWKQRRCKHSNVWETQACDAICCTCGKNLGFIQNWRNRKAAAK
jgi:hypothetical protein